jgi:hypothetical protein
MACEESTKQSAAAGTPAPAPAGQAPLAEGLAPGQGGPLSQSVPVSPVSARSGSPARFEPSTGT